MKNYLRSIVMLTSGVALLCPIASAATVFVNGSFEADATSGFQSVDPTGWVTHRTGAPPYLIKNSTYGNTPFGNQFLALGGSEDGATSWIEQSVSGFTIGSTYLLTWAQSSEFTSSDQLRVSFTSGSSTPAQTFTTPPYPGGSQFWIGWTNESMSFVASATSVNFHFQGTSSLNYEVGVDNFQVSGVGSSVPEPSSAILLGSAMLLLGGSGLRRRLKGRAVRG